MLEIVVILVGWMTDVGSVDPAFKPRSLAIDGFYGFADLQYIKRRVHVTFVNGNTTQSMLMLQSAAAAICRSEPIQTGYAFNC